MTPNVVNLNPSRLHESVPPFLTMLGAGPGIRNALRVLLPRLPKDQQRALLTVVAFRLMGAQLPANFALLERLPPLAGLHDQTLAAAFQMLVESGHLDVDQEQMTFFWPQLEALFDGQVALEDTLAKEAIERLTQPGPDQAEPQADPQ